MADSIGIRITDYHRGYADGLHQAARILREGATQYEIQGIDSRKVLEAASCKLANDLMRSWANGLDIEAEKAVSA